MNEFEYISENINRILRQGDVNIIQEELIKLQDAVKKNHIRIEFFYTSEYYDNKIKELDNEVKSRVINLDFEGAALLRSEINYYIKKRKYVEKLFLNEAIPSCKINRNGLCEIIINFKEHHQIKLLILKLITIRKGKTND